MKETPATLVQKFKISDLEAADYNPRSISPEALAGLRESLASYELLAMPIVNIAGGKRRLVGGHQRIKALKEEGFTHADCVVVSYDEATEKLANLTLNNPAIQGTFDPLKAIPELDKIAAQIPKPDHARFDALMTEMKEQAERMGKAEAKKKAEDATPATPVAPVSKIDTMYILGKHKLWCGDALVGIPKALGKKKANACITDPPYAVAYESAAGESIANDALEGEEWRTFIAAFSKLILAKTDGACIVFMSCKEMPAFQEGWESQGGIAQRWLWWVKDRFALSRGDYHNQQEPALYGWRNGLSPAQPHKARTNVLEYPKPQNNALHPTQKPVELIRDLVLELTTPGQLVIDPFGGSGTTLAACEETGRVCYTSEMLPVFVDRIRKRWAEQVHGEGCDWQALTAPA